MSRRHQGMKAGIARRIVIAGAIPLAVAVGCSSTTDHAADTAAPNTAAGQSSSPQTPGHPAPGHSGPEAAAPAEGAQPPAAGNPGDGITGPRAITSSPVQPGVTTPAADQDRLGHQPRPVQPGVTTTPNPLAPQVQPQPQSDYPIPANYRPIPNRDVAPAVDLGALHAPAPVAPVAPIAPPPRTVRIGDFTAPAPDQLPDPALDTVNGVAANTEAALATGLNSIGVNPSRSDKIAAGTLGGGIIGSRPRRSRRRHPRRSCGRNRGRPGRCRRRHRDRLRPRHDQRHRPALDRPHRHPRRHGRMAPSSAPP